MKKYALPISVLFLLVSLLLPYESMGLVLSFMIAVILLFNPKQGLLFLIIYFPIRPALLELNENIKYLGDLVILILFFQSLWYWLENKKVIGKVNMNIFMIGFLSFCLIGAISAFVMDVSIIAIIFQLRAFLITFLLIFIVSIQKINKTDVFIFLWTTVIMAVILCIQGIIEKASLRTWLIPESWSLINLPETNRIRIYGLIGNPNVLATYLSIAFVFSIYLKTVFTKYRFILNTSSIVIFGVFLLTYSRGTIIAIMVGFIVYLLLSKNWRVMKPIALSILLSLPLIYFPVVAVTDYMEEQQQGTQQQEEPSSVENEVTDRNGDFRKRMTEAFDKSTIEQSSQWGRLYIVKKGLEIFVDHPIIGTGFGTFGDSASLSYPSPIIDQYQIPSGIYSDNQYIQIITQTGILGVLSFATFIIGLIVMLWKKRKQAGVAILLMALLIGGSVAGLFYNIWEDKTFTMYFYILLGYILNRGYWEKHHQT
ncbi:O-antigen ligase [Bacillus sp. V3B]|uniref:O-antigen ligase family protein n=1 Tax=Bacillus sp. V3B TaxID=2804915 RepID=UPI00210D5D19|nr:O-antigen ligase family protein [Bacillus sp. V3B]